MGFLDRMVSDLIYKSTGIKAKGLVRKVGGKNILLAGAGAVIAAALSEQKSERDGTAKTWNPQPQPQPATTPVQPLASTTAIPTPADAVAPPPPLPPIPTMSTTSTMPTTPAASSVEATRAPILSMPTAPSANEPTPAASPAAVDEVETEDPPPEVSFLAVRTLVAASLADGELSPPEKAIIERHLQSSNLTLDQRQQIHNDMVLPPSPTELAVQVTDPELRAALYRFAVLMIKVDNKVTDLEKAWLVRLGEAFEIPTQRRHALEDEVFSRA